MRMRSVDRAAAAAAPECWLPGTLCPDQPLPPVCMASTHPPRADAVVEATNSQGKAVGLQTAETESGAAGTGRPPFLSPVPPQSTMPNQTTARHNIPRRSKWMALLHPLSIEAS